MDGRGSPRSPPAPHTPALCPEPCPVLMRASDGYLTGSRGNWVWEVSGFPQSHGWWQTWAQSLGTPASVPRVSRDGSGGAPSNGSACCHQPSLCLSCPWSTSLPCLLSGFPFGKLFWVPEALHGSLVCLPAASHCLTSMSALA